MLLLVTQATWPCPCLAMDMMRQPSMLNKSYEKQEKETKQTIAAMIEMDLDD
jgi:hypothetical protein